MKKIPKVGEQFKPSDFIPNIHLNEGDGFMPLHLMRDDRLQAVDKIVFCELTAYCSRQSFDGVMDIANHAKLLNVSEREFLTSLAVLRFAGYIVYAFTVNNSIEYSITNHALGWEV